MPFQYARSIQIGLLLAAVILSVSPLGSAQSTCVNGEPAVGNATNGTNTTNGTNATLAPDAAPCSSCDAGYFGEACDHQCTCINGTCNDGIDGNGLCNACNAGYYGPNCDNKCTCFRGTCNDGPLGNGLCSECQTNFTGSACDKCKTGNYGPNCSDVCTMCENGSCLSTITGNGSCAFCFANYYGLYCNNSCSCPQGQVCNSGLYGDGSCRVFGGGTPEPSDSDDDTPEPTIAPAPEPTTQTPFMPDVQSLTVTLNVDIADFSATNFSRDLAMALELNASNVEVLDFRSGSVIVTFRLVGMSADAIQAKYRELIGYLSDPANSPLAGMGITGYTIGFDPVETPEPTSEPANSDSPDSSQAPQIIDSADSDDGLGTGAIIGIVIGAVAGVIVIAVLVFCAVKKYKADHKEDVLEEAREEAMKQQRVPAAVEEHEESEAIQVDPARELEDEGHGAHNEVAVKRDELISHLQQEAATPPPAHVQPQQEDQPASAVPSYTPAPVPPAPAPASAVATGAVASEEIVQHNKKRKACKHCGGVYGEVPDLCPVANESHITIRANRKAEKKAKKGAKLGATGEESD